MIATITITRRDHRNEDRDFLVDVTRDRDGDIWATCGEDVDELRTINRHGSIETYSTGRLFQRRGEPVELNDDELEEAEAALAQLEALWQAERARLKEIFAPAGAASASGEVSIAGSDDTECYAKSVNDAENESGFGRLKNAQARFNASSSEAARNLEPPGARANSTRSLLRHDLLNSQGIDIALPPEVKCGHRMTDSEPGELAVESASTPLSAHE